MQTLLHNLNPEQRAAVTLPNESALILAGAGSGKTRVLTTRIAWLIQNGYTSPAGVMAVTFTNKAAKEMQARLAAMLPINTRGMWIGTFHGLCNRLLRAHFLDASLPQAFQILDTQDQLSMVKRIFKANQIDDAKYPPRSAVYFINDAKEQGLRASKVITHDPTSRQYAEIYGIYEQQCQRDGVVDFAELLLRTVELLTNNQPLREHYQRRFRHILVDEFQDTNNLQYRWIKLMAGVGESAAAVLAVGDDDQSIYAFRGANVGNMASFERDFQVKHRIKLEQNYRSHGHILDAANALISNNAERLGKNLRTDAGPGELIRIQETSSDTHEAQWLVEQIKELLRQGFNNSEIAVLYRSNAQSRVIEHALFSAGLPYRVYGGLRFFERAEIKHAIAYLQLLDNPHNDSAFLRVINFPARGIGAKTQENLQDIARAHAISLYSAVALQTGKASSTLGAFVKLIDSARAETQQLPLPELVQRMLELSTLLQHYQNEKEGADRIENLEQLVGAADLFIAEEGFDKNTPALMGPTSNSIPPIMQGEGVQILNADATLATTMSPLSAFLSHASLEAGDNQAQAGQDALQLMTVHSAKGLEFDAVFITGLEEGLFPHENSAKAIDGMEEERRLMYVATTRAKQRLFLSFAQTRMMHGQIRYNAQSRFLSELPDENVKWLTPQIKHNWFAPPKSAWDSDGNFMNRSTFQQRSRASFSTKIANPMHHNIAIKNEDGWRPGLNVKHAKFGEGIIVKLEGSGTHCRAHIQFNQSGLKVLDLTVAKLEKA